MDIAEVISIIVWPLTIFLFLTFFTIFFRAQIRELLAKVIVRYKRGDTELEVVQQVIQVQKEAEIQTVSDLISSPVLPEESSRVLDSGLKSPDELMDEMSAAMYDGNLEEGRNLYLQLQEAERDPVEKGKREGIYYYFLYQRGDTSALHKLSELTKNPDISHYAHHWLGLCYETSEDYEKAFTEYQLAVQQAKSQSQRADYIVSSARSLHRNSKKRDALQYIMAELEKTTEAEALATLYSGMAFLYGLEENYEFRALALEKAIENKPNDTQWLFDAAYSYSQVNQDELSLLYYNTLLNFSPENPMALNNIGVAYSRLQMPIQSISSQKKAFDLGNTLAGSNIALGYLEAGFADEASQVIEQARGKEETIHRNIGSTFAQIADNKEKERKHEKEVLENAREQQRFLRVFGEAYFVHSSGIDLSGTWCFSDGIEVILVQEKNVITIEWTEGKQVNKFKGELVNRAAKMDAINPGYISADDIAAKLYAAPNCKTINIMIKRYNKFIFKVLEKKQMEAIATN